jgi:transposase
LPKDKQEELREMIAKQNQRVWVARHIYEWLSITCRVFYSVRYLPEFLRNLGLSFHKAVHTLIRRDNEKRKQWMQKTILALYAHISSSSSLSSVSAGSNVSFIDGLFFAFF